MVGCNCTNHPHSSKLHVDCDELNVCICAYSWTSSGDFTVNEEGEELSCDINSFTVSMLFYVSLIFSLLTICYFLRLYFLRESLRGELRLHDSDLENFVSCLY